MILSVIDGYQHILFMKHVHLFHSFQISQKKCRIQFRTLVLVDTERTENKSKSKQSLHWILEFPLQTGKTPTQPLLTYGHPHYTLCYIRSSNKRSRHWVATPVCLGIQPVGAALSTTTVDLDPEEIPARYLWSDRGP